MGHSLIGELFGYRFVFVAPDAAGNPQGADNAYPCICPSSFLDSMFALGWAAPVAMGIAIAAGVSARSRKALSAWLVVLWAATVAWALREGYADVARWRSNNAFTEAVDEQLAGYLTWLTAQFLFDAVFMLLIPAGLANVAVKRRLDQGPRTAP